MRKIITFLGRRPQPTQYSFQDKVYSGSVFAEALRQFVDFDQMLVCLTEEARQDAWPVLQNLHDPRIIDIPIPRGETTVEMWAMFDAILKHIDEQDIVIFDITHGLRSLPFLVFLFAAYLKTARNAVIEAIYYGAFELGDSKTQKPAPVIDLSEFVTMLDWLTATDQFVQTGNAQWLAKLINPLQAERGAVAAASQTLSQVSQAALLCQPFTLMSSVIPLANDLHKATGELEHLAPPFQVLSEKIAQTFSHFKVDFHQDPAQGLAVEFSLVEWYYHNRQYVQAITLAREWLIDAVTHHLGMPIDFKRDVRAPFEDAITGIVRVGREVPDWQTGEKRIFTIQDLNEYGRIIYTTWPERDDLIKIWGLISPVRNAIDHAEHQAGALKLAKIDNKINQAMPLLNNLASRWGLKPS